MSSCFFLWFIFVFWFTSKHPQRMCQYKYVIKYNLDLYQNYEKIFSKIEICSGNQSHKSNQNRPKKNSYLKTNLISFFLLKFTYKFMFSWSEITFLNLVFHMDMRRVDIYLYVSFLKMEWLKTLICKNDITFILSIFPPVLMYKFMGYE